METTDKLIGVDTYTEKRKRMLALMSVELGMQETETESQLLTEVQPGEDVIEKLL